MTMTMMMIWAELLIVLLLSITPTRVSATWNETAKKIQLPRVEVQFICAYDIQSSFNVSEIFDGFYRNQSDSILLPVDDTTTTLKDTRFRSDLKMSGMSDIQPQKWYYSSCNISSPQVLITLEIDGWAHLEQQ
jgi:hypothetical protein